MAALAALGPLTGGMWKQEDPSESPDLDPLRAGLTEKERKKVGLVLAPHVSVVTCIGHEDLPPGSTTPTTP